jgi:hypothetical protein
MLCRHSCNVMPPSGGASAAQSSRPRFTRIPPPCAIRSRQQKQGAVSSIWINCLRMEPVARSLDVAENSGGPSAQACKPPDRAHPSPRKRHRWPQIKGRHYVDQKPRQVALGKPVVKSGRKHQTLVDRVRIEVLPHRTNLKQNLLPTSQPRHSIYARQTPRKQAIFADIRFTEANLCLMRSVTSGPRSAPLPRKTTLCL